MRIGCPTWKPARIPPAAFVSTTTRQPAATAVRTPCTTVAGWCPSYRCVRPRNTSSRSLPVTSERTVPAWPGTVEAANPPRSATGISVTAAPSAAATASAAGTQPEPRTTAASYPAWPVCSANLAALAAAAPYGSAGASRGAGSGFDIRFAVGRGRPDPADQAGDGNDGGDVGGHQQDVRGNRDVDRGQRGLQRVGKTKQQRRRRRAQGGPAAEDHRGEGDVAEPRRHVLGECPDRADGQVGPPDARD